MDKPKYYVKFTGKFTDLIPDGWTFQKLFANNYRQYSKTSDGKKYGPTFRVWQHHGGYIEFADYYCHTWLIFNWVSSGAYLTAKCKTIFGGVTYYRGAIDSENETIEDYDVLKHDCLFIDKFHPGFENLPEEEQHKIINAIYDRYRKVTINDAEVNFILDLKKKGWFGICNDERRH